MVSVVSLWLPILVSAVAVFVVSSVLHMVLTYHQSDFQAVPKETETMAALRASGIPPGDYMMPHGGSAAAMKSPEFTEKLKQGPVAILTVLPSGQMNMGSSLAQWFVYCVVVAIFVAAVTGHAYGPGTESRDVFHVVALTAFVGYALALAQGSIWYKRKWSSTLKSMFDGLIYALATAGVFVWLWP